MKITNITGYKVKMTWSSPFAKQHAASYYRPPVMDSVIIKVHTDEGLVGYGEATPVQGVFGENCEGIIALLKQYAKQIKGMDPCCIGEIHSIMDNLARRGNITAKFAIDIALYDIMAQKMGVPLYKFIGGLQRSKVKSHISIAAGDSSEMAADAIAVVKRGFSVIKVKVTGNGKDDLDKVLAVLEAVDGKATLAIDVNEGWTVPDTIRIAKMLYSHKAYADNVIIEQPIVAHDLDGLEYITRSTPIPILADESAWSVNDVMKVANRRVADIIGIKVVETCGIWGALQAIGICEAANMPYLVDEACDTKIANTVIAHVAMAAGQGLVYAGCANHTLYEEDVVAEGGVELHDGFAVLKDEPGLGIKSLSIGSKLSPEFEEIEF
jgi:L-alanine-DL-glutamate epimerase-like enolase superfamily enzyme